MLSSLLPGVSPDILAITLAAVTGGVLLMLLGLGAAHPLLLRMGLRNTARRPRQTLVLLCGLALSTAVITASFGLSDSFTSSAIQHRLARMGNVDESMTGPFTQLQVNNALRLLRQNRHVQAVTALGIYPGSPTVTSLRTGISVHDADFYAIPPDFEQTYGSVTDTQGNAVHFADLQTDSIFVSVSLGEALDLRPGDRVQVIFDKPIVVTVRAILSNEIGVTTGEAIANSTPEILMPLARAQQIDPEPPNTISIKNAGPDAANSGNSQAVIHLLQQLFPGASASLSVPHAFGTTDFEIFRIHPLQPAVADQMANLLQINKLVFLSSAGQQFSWLPPLFTCLLVGAGMLLLVLLVILLAAERRAELGISRALGLRRGDLVQLLLFEGLGYSICAALAGILLGLGLTALEIAMFTLLPSLTAGTAGNALPTPVIAASPLHTWLSWQSLLSAGSLGILTTLATILLTGIWISRLSIVTAIRDLDDPTSSQTSLAELWHMLWSPARDANGDFVPETTTRRIARVTGAAGGILLWLGKCGLLWLLAGGILLALKATGQSAWMEQLGIALLIAGGGLLVKWVAGAASSRTRSLGKRLGLSLTGLGWLLLGLRSGDTFLALFQPVLNFNGPPSTPNILLSMLLPVTGAVVLVMTNIDLLAALVSALLRWIHKLAPISRPSVVYPLTFRFRTGVTVALLSLIIFLVLLLVTTNLGAIQEAQASANTGGFQLEADAFGSQFYHDPALTAQFQELQNHQALSRDFSAVGLLRLMYDYPTAGAPQPLHLDLAGRPAYSLSKPPQVADSAFLASTSMPMYARAAGFTSDQQIWAALQAHPGYAVLQYDSHIAGLPASNGFAPFGAEIPDSSTPTAHYHRVTVIGLVPANAPWRVLVSVSTAASIIQPPYIQFINTYLFRLQPGVSEAQATQDLNRFLQASAHGIDIQSLDQASFNGITSVFTLFLSGYLALGLLFGALAIGVIASRAVVERRQQIGMLRALGFSRTLIQRTFLLESSFIILLGLLVGTSLALWLAFQIARATYQDFPLPILPVTLILLSVFLITLIGTTLPARKASRLPPAEALRYE